MLHPQDHGSTQPAPNSELRQVKQTLGRSPGAVPRASVLRVWAKLGGFGAYLFTSKAVRERCFQKGRGILQAMSRMRGAQIYVED